MSIRDKALEIIKREKYAIAEKKLLELKGITPVVTGFMKASYDIEERGVDVFSKDDMKVVDNAPYSEAVNRRRRLVERVIR